MNRLRRRTLAILMTTAVLLIAAGIGYANRAALLAWGYEQWLSKPVEEKLEHSYEPLPNRPPATGEPTAAAREEPFSVLLMGVDARGGERGRSDTLIYTVVRPEDGQVLMVSIPRDTYAEIAGRNDWDKITHAYAFGGPEMAVESVEKLLDAKVDHYASINFQGFVEAVDLLGGIPLPITKDIVNKDPEHEKFTIRANQTVYSGKDALNFVRYREDAGGDMARTERNRQFLESLIRKASSLRQWSKIPELLTVIGDHFRTDIPPAALSDLAKKFLQTDHRIQSYTLRGEGKRMGPDRLWYFVADEDDLNAVRRTIADWLNPDADAGSLSVPGAKDRKDAAL